MFGYETPDEESANRTAGTDFETVGMVRIESHAETSARAWGVTIAEQFLKRLYNDDSVSWTARKFAHWIENTPDDRVQKEWHLIPILKDGEVADIPTLDALVRQPYER